MATASNTSISYQGAADAARTLPDRTGAFTDARFGRNSVVDAVLMSVTEGAPVPTEFDPSGQPSVNLFLWMTDRVIFQQATQFYDNTVFVGTTNIGSSKSERARNFVPTNGVAALPPGAFVAPASPAEVGRALRLAYTGGGSSFDARGTALVLQLTNNDYLDASGGDPAVCQVDVTAVSECLLAGNDQAIFTTLVGGAYSPFGAPALFKRSVVLLASDYFAGQYWKTNNQLTRTAGGATFIYDIVGIYTVPVPPGP